MMNAVRISGIRVKCNPLECLRLKNDLTITCYDYITSEKYKCHCYIERPPYLWIPRHYPLPYNIIDRPSAYKHINISSNIMPRDDVQEDAIKALSKDLNDITLQLPPGYGKTVISIASVANLKVKTLVIVDSRDLASQWVDSFKKFTNTDVIFDTKCKLEHDVNVVTIQKMLSDLRRNKRELFLRIQKSMIGVVVFDEVHALIGPEQFTLVCFTLPVKKFITVSATPFRLDESGKILKYWIGDRKYSVDSTFQVAILIWCFDSKIPTKTWKYITWSNSAVRQRYLKMLAKQHTFYDAAIDIIKFIRKEGRKALLLCERTDMIEKISKTLDEMKIDHSCYYGNKDRSALKSNLVIATYAKCNKAIDIPHIDTLVYMTPISNPITLEQTKGRIQRQYKDKKSPLIIDVVDLSGQSYILEALRKRLMFYKESNFDVKYHNNCDGLSLLQ